MKEKTTEQFFRELFSNRNNGKIMVTRKPGTKTDLVTPDFFCEGLRENPKDLPLFFTPSLFEVEKPGEHGQGKTKKNVTDITALHFDFDNDVDLEKLKDKYDLPDYSYVFTRGYKKHVYFLLKPFRIDTDTKAHFEKIIKAITKKLKADSLPATCCAYMRVPGTLHVKNSIESPGYVIDQELSSGNRYDLLEFEKFIDKKEKNKKPEVEKTDDEKGRVKEILFAPAMTIREGEGRSKFLYFLSLRCHDFGLEESEALEIIKEANTLYCIPPESEEVSEHQCISAYRYAQYAPGRYDDEKDDEYAYATDFRIYQSLRNYVYCVGNESLYDMKRNLAYTTQGQISNQIAHISGIDKKFTYILRFRLLEIADKISFQPMNESRLYDDREIIFYNSFNPIITEKGKVTSEAVKIFKDHIKYLTSNEAEYNHLLDYIATTLTKPGIKIKHAIFLSSKEKGIGKSVLEELYRALLKDYVTTSQNKEIAEGRNGWMDSKLVCFVHEVGQQDKYSVLANLNSWITDHKIRISDKYTRSYETDNFCNFFFFSNPQNAIPVDEGDRRFYVIRPDVLPKPPAYYEKLYEAFLTKPWDIYEFLNRRKVSFNPNAPAPMTLAKKELLQITRPELFTYLDAVHEEGSLDKLLEDKLSIKNLYDSIEMLLPFRIRQNFNLRQLSFWMDDKGFVKKEAHVKENGKKKHIRYFQKLDEVKK